jgi:hypothetical protein
MSKIILGSLDKNQLVVFNKLGSFRNLGILGGDTALALQIGHRVSFDFDIFTFKKLDDSLWKKVKAVFGKGSVKTLDTSVQLNLITPENVAVTFFNDEYKNIFDPVSTSTINLLNIKDIAANKAYVIGRRPKWRDYVDLYFLLRDKYFSLKELINLAEKKFDSDFSEKLFLEQLIYWSDIQDYTIDFIRKTIPEEEIKTFLEDEERKFIKEIS